MKLIVRLSKALKIKKTTFKSILENGVEMREIYELIDPDCLFTLATFVSCFAIALIAFWLLVNYINDEADNKGNDKRKC